MNKTQDRLKIELQPYDRDRLGILCGPCDENITKIETSNQVTIAKRENVFSILGSKQNIASTAEQIHALYALTDQQNSITSKDIHHCVRLHGGKENSLKVSTMLELPNKTVHLQNKTQKAYIDRVHNHTINFALGPSGTGKTYLAVAAAAHALVQQSVERIILVRPAVDAGEKLGFLPGDMAQKVDPYLRPFYDALYELITLEQTMHFIEKGKIEVAPLAFMRGRTLSEAFIILDEAQNSSNEQMKMLLTRLGHDSKMVITGDLTQIDLPRSQGSGLAHAESILQDIPRISFTYFNKRDVVRHDLIQSIITAYEDQ